MQETDERTLIERARKEPEAFAELYQHYLPRVYRYLYLRLGNQHDSEDIASQVFIELLNGLRQNKYRETGCFPAWLFTIVRRRLVDFRRHRPALEVNEAQGFDLDLLEQVQSQEDVKRLEALVARLDGEKQELLRLRFAAELSFAEIAALEGQSEGAVKMSVYRAIQWLRERWVAEDE